MFTRSLPTPRSSFFLFGARGTGKSTWIRSRFEDAFVVNLLASEVMLRYERDPAEFRAEVLAHPRSRWIVVWVARLLRGLRNSGTEQLSYPLHLRCICVICG